MIDFFSRPILDIDARYIACSDADAFVGLYGKSVFITGSTGFFGAWIIQAIDALNRYCDARINMVLLTRNEEILEQRLVGWGVDRSSWTLIEGDVTDPSAYIGIDEVPSIILHLASLPNLSGERSWYSEYLYMACLGLKSLLCAAETWGVANFVFASSGGAYQLPNVFVAADGRFRVTEAAGEDLVNQKNFYGLTKRVQETVLIAESGSKKLNVAIARCFAFIGPYLNLNENYAIGNFIRSRLEGESVVVESDGRARRSYMYMADLARQLLLLATARESSLVVNVGGEVPYTIEEVARLVATTSLSNGGGHIPVVPVLVKNRFSSGSDYLPDVSCGHGLSLPEAIKRSFEWYLG